LLTFTVILQLQTNGIKCFHSTGETTVFYRYSYLSTLFIKTALKSLNPAIAIAGGIALVALGTLVKNSLAAPKLAEGGLAYGPTMATVGDNRNARVDPEVIAPLSKLKSMMGDMGVGGSLETRISGNDLIILLNRSQKGLSRIQ